MFDNKDDALFPNQFVNARLLVETLPRRDAASPPPRIQQNGPESFVYVDPGRGGAHPKR